MKKNNFLLLACVPMLLSVLGCKPDFNTDAKVTVYAVPEKGDIVWENDVCIYRVSADTVASDKFASSIDVWVKKPGRLVSKEWCWEARRHQDRLLSNHDGQGGDCYYADNSLGLGGSAYLKDSTFVPLPTPCRSFDVLRRTEDELIFVLHYPTWDLSRFHDAWLDKQIEIKAGSNFCKVTDFYSGHFDELTVAVGLAVQVNDNGISARQTDNNCLAWDWGAVPDTRGWNPTDCIGTALIVPDTCDVKMEMQNGHIIMSRTIVPDEPFVYYIGSCWTGGNFAGCDKDQWPWHTMIQELNFELRPQSQR